MEDIRIINERLAERFGTDLQGNPNWRIVWSETEFEKRLGYFPDSLGITGEKKELRTVRKYSYIRDRYILERRCPLPQTDELPEASMVGYSYEALYVFEDKNRNMLPVRWHPIEIFIRVALDGPQAFFTSRTEQIEKDGIEEDEVKYFEELLENESPYLATMLHNREAVVVAKPEKPDGNE